MLCAYRVMGMGAVLVWFAGCGPAAEGELAESARSDLQRGEILAGGSVGCGVGKATIDAVVDAEGEMILGGAFSGRMDLGEHTLESAGRRDVFVAKLDPRGRVIWGERFGDDDDQRLERVGVDGAGDIFVLGSARGAVDFGGCKTQPISAHAEEIVLAKLAPDGQCLWQRRFGGGEIQHAQVMAVDAMGDVLIGGWFEGALDLGKGPLEGYGHLFLAKLDERGVTVYARVIRGASDLSIGALAADGKGGACMTGVLYGTADFGGALHLRSAGGTDAFVACFDPRGEPRWARRYGNGDYQEGRAVAVDEAGNVLVSGWFEGIVDLGGGPLFPRVRPGGAGDFIAKLDPKGDHLWSLAFEGVDYDARRALAVDPEGEVLFAASASRAVSFGGLRFEGRGGVDVLAAKLDSSGRLVWAERYGDALDQRFASLSVSNVSNGRPRLMGVFEGRMGESRACGESFYWMELVP